MADGIANVRLVLQAMEINVVISMSAKVNPVMQMRYVKIQEVHIHAAVSMVLKEVAKHAKVSLKDR